MLYLAISAKNAYLSKLFPRLEVRDDQVELPDELVDAVATLDGVLDVAESIRDRDLVQRIELLHVFFCEVLIFMKHVMKFGFDPKRLEL